MTLPSRPEMTEERFAQLGIVGLKHGWSYAERVEVITELSALREARREQEEQHAAEVREMETVNDELRALVREAIEVVGVDYRGAAVQWLEKARAAIGDERKGT